jgi:hypothetical protein
MHAVKIFSAAPVALLLAATAVAPHDGPVEPLLAPLAHSAQLTLEGASVPGALLVRVRPLAGGAALEPAELSVAVEGKELPASPRADGALRVALPETAAGNVQVDVTVNHDGIRELLSAQLPVEPAPAPAAASRFGVHTQLLWWVLNIAIVLIAVITISRRVS